MRTIAASKFKATCLSLMDEVQAKREPVTVTKHGKPMVMMVPLDLAEGVDPLDAYLYPGVEFHGDIMAPLYTDEELDEFERNSLAQLL